MKPQEYGGSSPTFFSKRVAKVRENQVKAHSRMMRSTGSAPPYTTDERKIQKGDLVRVRRDALLTYRADREETHGAVGEPEWHNKVYRVQEVIDYGERFRLEGFNQNKDGSVREFWKFQVQKYNHVRIGDIVRVSMETIGKYRQYVQSKIQGNKDNEALMFNHSFTRALFRVTSMNKDKTRYFLELVWDPTKPLEKTGRAPFPLLEFETKIKITERDADEDARTPIVADKDKFHGFRPSYLLVVDEWTSNLFNNPDLTPKARQDAYTACVMRNQIRSRGSSALDSTKSKLKAKPPPAGTGGAVSCDLRYALKQYLVKGSTTT